MRTSGQLRRQCKGCGKALVITQSPDGGLEVILDFLSGADTPQTPLRRPAPTGTARTIGSDLLASRPKPPALSPPGSMGKSPGGATQRNEQEFADLGTARDAQPSSGPTSLRVATDLSSALGKLDEAVRSVDGKLDTALKAIEGLQERLAEIQAILAK